MTEALAATSGIKVFDAEYLQASAAATATDLATGDHIKFDSVVLSAGTSITLDTATPYTNVNNVASVGRFTLAAGHTYRLFGCAAYMQGSVADSIVDYAWFNADTGVAIGNSGRIQASARATNDNGDGTVATLFSPSVSTRVEIRYTGNLNAAQVGAATILPWAIIERIS